MSDRHALVNRDKSQILAGAFGSLFLPTEKQLLQVLCVFHFWRGTGKNLAVASVVVNEFFRPACFSNSSDGDTQKQSAVALLVIQSDQFLVMVAASIPGRVRVD